MTIVVCAVPKVVVLFRSELADHAMLKGMTGYQLTPCDLEFIEKMQEERIIKKLQVCLLLWPCFLNDVSVC